MQEEEVICKSCGTHYNLKNEDCVCPNCGCKSKIVLASSNIEIPIYILWKIKGKRFGKWIFKMIFGYDKSIKLNRQVKIRRLLDWENDDYKEIITDPKTGEIIHQCEEKLSNHQGHGSAKRQNK